MVQDQHRDEFHGSDILACGAYRAGGSERCRDRRGLVREQPGGEAAGLQIAAAGALSEQFADAVTGGLGVGGERGEVAAVAARRVECGEDVCQLVCEFAAKASGRRWFSITVRMRQQGD